MEKFEIEIIFSHDQYTGKRIQIDDEDLLKQQVSHRENNHMPSALSKAKGGHKAINYNPAIGDLVYIKHAGNKFNCHDLYLVVQKTKSLLLLQKFQNGKLSSKKYEVPITSVFPATNNQPSNTVDDQCINYIDDESSDDDYYQSAEQPLDEPDPVNHDAHNNLSETETTQETEYNVAPTTVCLRPPRNPGPPDWFGDCEYD